MKLICKSCGSTNIHRDAWAVWDEQSQEWRLGDVYDNEVWCEDCEEPGWSNIEEVEDEPNAEEVEVEDE